MWLRKLSVYVFAMPVTAALPCCRLHVLICIVWRAATKRRETYVGVRACSHSLWPGCMLSIYLLCWRRPRVSIFNCRSLAQLFKGSVQLKVSLVQGLPRSSPRSKTYIIKIMTTEHHSSSLFIFFQICHRLCMLPIITLCQSRAALLNNLLSSLFRQTAK